LGRHGARGTVGRDVEALPGQGAEQGQGPESPQVNARRLALVLVGWYLMVPPIDQIGSTYRVEMKAPLSRWIVNSNYDRADECNSVKSGLVPESIKKAQHFKHGTREWAIAARLISAECIKADDPRVAE
jgi:hypothetical protein